MAAMSEQRGLRNTHGTTSDGEPYCESCGVCDEGWRCRCCLAAEVAALRARIAPWTGTTMREHMSCNDLAVSEGGCAGENCRLPVCVVCGRDWPCPVQRVLDLLVHQIVGDDGHVRDMLLRADVLRALDGDA